MPASLTYADFSIKARCASPQIIEQKLQDLNAHFTGEDLQTDTYFQVPVGKLKLREGNIENLLTHYLREEHDGKMKTTVFLYERDPGESLKRQYTGSLPVVGRVTKTRRIYWIENVKFHIDRFPDHQTFIEIEAIDREGNLGIELISRQAEKYKELLSISEEDILKESYIDMR
jgi:adenylate cyclase, class 2